MRRRLVLISFISVTFILLSLCGLAVGEVRARYVFLFIGDGMGRNQRLLAQVLYGRSFMNELPVQGMMSTSPAGGGVTDSAAAATALATGFKTVNGVLGMDPGKTRKLTTLAELAKRRGMKVGIITNTPIDDATPAAFYAHQPSRLNYYDISVDMVRSGFDYLAGGRPVGNSERHRKGREDIFTLARDNGYRIVKDERGFRSLGVGESKVMVFDQAPSLYYEIDRPKETVSLSELLRKGIEILYGPRGFLMVIEGGKIDWACHANDAFTAAEEVRALDEAVMEALKFYREHPKDTLIVVTADHECGGLELDLSSGRYELLKKQRMSYARFSRELSKGKNLDLLVEEAFTLRLSDLGGLPRVGDSPVLAIFHAFGLKAGVKWSTRGHTDALVPISAIGVGQELFSGYQDNTDVARKIMRIAGLTF